MLNPIPKTPIAASQKPISTPKSKLPPPILFHPYPKVESGVVRPHMGKWNVTIRQTATFILR